MQAEHEGCSMLAPMYVCTASAISAPCQVGCLLCHGGEDLHDTLQSFAELW